MEDIKSLVLSDKNENISKILSSSFEYVDHNTNVIHFDYPWSKEIIYDYSGVYQKIKGFIHYVKDPEYEETIRIAIGQPILLVYKFKVPNKVVEVVLKIENGKYLIWEIHNYRY